MHPGRLANTIAEFFSTGDLPRTGVGDGNREHDDRRRTQTHSRQRTTDGTTTDSGHQGRRGQHKQNGQVKRRETTVIDGGACARTEAERQTERQERWMETRDKPIDEPCHTQPSRTHLMGETDNMNRIAYGVDGGEMDGRGRTRHTRDKGNAKPRGCYRHETHRPPRICERAQNQQRCAH